MGVFMNDWRLGCHVKEPDTSVPTHRRKVLPPSLRWKKQKKALMMAAISSRAPLYSYLNIERHILLGRIIQRYYSVGKVKTL
jgi:hypothetical protein